MTLKKEYLSFDMSISHSFITIAVMWKCVAKWRILRHAPAPARVDVPAVKHAGAQRPESVLAASWQDSVGLIKGLVSDSELENKGHSISIQWYQWVTVHSSWKLCLLKYSFNNVGTYIMLAVHYPLSREDEIREITVWHCPVLSVLGHCADRTFQSS